MNDLGRVTRATASSAIAVRSEPPLGPWRRAVVLLLAGACAALALPPLYLVPVLPVMLFVLLRFAESARSWRAAALYGFWFGLGLHTAGLYWLTNAILTRVDTFWWVVPIAAPGCALLLAPFAAVPAVLCRLAPSGWPRVLVFAGAWTFADMGRVFLFTGFPWNPLGSIWEWPGRAGDVLMQPASVVGVDGLTLFGVLAALGVWQGRWAIALAACTFAAWIGFGIWRLDSVRAVSSVNPVVVLVQGNVSESEKLARSDLVAVFQRYLDLTRQGMAQAQVRYPGRAIAFAWPETAFPGLLDEDTLDRQAIMRAGEGATYGLIGTLRDDGRGHWFNSVMAVDPRGAVAAAYDKSTLVPFGEYQPAFIPFNILPAQLTPGSGLKTWHLPGIGAVAPLVCYEVIFSGHVARRDARPDWLLNVTNDAWYGNSAGPRQHLASVRMRAVEEGLPIARAANTGISAAYGPTGHELGRLGWGVPGSLPIALPSPLPPTVFARFGRLIPILLSLLCILAGIAMRPRKTSRLKNY